MDKQVLERGSARPVLVAGVLIAGLLALGVLPRLARQERAVATAEAATNRTAVVSTAPVKAAAGSAELELPGNIEPLLVAGIYARTNGYLHSRSVDIGSPVHAGQVLAVISAPEVDQELMQAKAALAQANAALEQARANLNQAQAVEAQAKANLGQAQANEELAMATNERWTKLVDNGVLPKQQGDERRSAYNARAAETRAAQANLSTAAAAIVARRADIGAAQALVEAQRANVARLSEVQGFQRLLAPFDGIVTERNVEKGDLVSAAATSGKPLFSVAQSKTLRIQVSVPQSYAVDLKTGQPAEVIVRERPGEKFTGQVVRTAGSVASATRTLLTEVQLDNSAGRLLPGMYGQVKFQLPRVEPVVLIPGSALVVNARGTSVYEIYNGNHVRRVPVIVGRDLGTEVEIVSGLRAPGKVVNNPPDTLIDGGTVELSGGPASGGKEEKK